MSNTIIYIIIAVIAYFVLVRKEGFYVPRPEPSIREKVGETKICVKEEIKPIYGFKTVPGRVLGGGGHVNICNNYKNNATYQDPKNGYQNVPTDYVLVRSGCEGGNCDGKGAWCHFRKP